MDQQNEANIKHYCKKFDFNATPFNGDIREFWIWLSWILTMIPSYLLKHRETKKRQNPVSEHLDMKSISETFSLKTNKNQRVNIKNHWMISTLLQKQISSLFIHLSVQQFMHNVLNFGNNMEHMMHHTAEFLSML